MNHRRTLVLLLVTLMSVLLLFVTFATAGAHVDARGREIAEMELQKTVGTVSGVCATTDSIVVDSGTNVIYCYQITNSGQVALTDHDLIDSELGTVFSGTYDLAPGASYSVTAEVTIDATVVNTATWTACEPVPTEACFVSTDTATVLVNNPSIVFTKTVGLDFNVCSIDDSIDVSPGTDVTYCFKVTNTGTVTLTRHHLVDSEFGIILVPNTPHDLGLGETIFVTASATIDVTTVNTATWESSNPGNNDVVSDTDTATVNVVTAPIIEVDPASLMSQQAADVQVTLPLTITNVGDADLDWTIVEGTACGNPSDIAWLSAIPISGTINPSSGQIVDVTFDSTGMVPGIYAESLCVESNDSLNPAIGVPVTLEIPDSLAIQLDKTVGLDPTTCAATNSISIPAGGGGTTVYYCYTATNNGTTTMTTHTLVDSEFGPLLVDFPYPLGSGESVSNVDFGYVMSATIAATTVNTATWTTADVTGASTSDTAVATVTVLPPTGVSLSSFGEAKPLGLTPLWLSAIVLVLLMGATLTWRRRTSR